MNKQYLVVGSLNIYGVHVDPEHGEELETLHEGQAQNYMVDAESPEEARWIAGKRAFNAHMKDSADMEKDTEMSLPKYGHGRYLVNDGDKRYAFHGVAFERAGE